MVWPLMVPDQIENNFDTWPMMSSEGFNKQTSIFF